MERMDTPSYKASPKEVFLHLLGVITLYASAISFLVLLFQYVNLYFPDLLQSGYYSSRSAYSSIRYAISTLIVVFPVYILTERALRKRYRENISLRSARIRKWLVYFTLFVAGLVGMGDLITLIFNLLGGELTIRFLLKVFSVFFVSGSVFAYYILDMKRNPGEK